MKNNLEIELQMIFVNMQTVQKHYLRELSGHNNVSA